METKELIKVKDEKMFEKMMDGLNLSDRQRKIFVLKYHHYMRAIDIAETLGVCQDTITDELRIIRQKLAAI